MKLNVILYIKNDCYQVGAKLKDLFSSLIHTVNTANLLNFTLLYNQNNFPFLSQHFLFL